MLPPDTTMFEKSSRRWSLGQVINELYTDELYRWYHIMNTVPRNEGWNRTSGHRNRSFPMVTTCPSGNSYRRISSDMHSLFKVEYHETQLFLHISDNLTLSSSGKIEAALSQDLHHVVIQLTAGYFSDLNSSRFNQIVEYGNYLCDSVTWF